jgi:ketosteroid isomerase-like protein
VSQESLATIEQFYDAMNRRDLDAVRALGRRFPDYWWRNADDEPESALRDARGGFAYVKELFESFDQIHTTIEEVVDLGPEATAIAVHHRVRGASSGVEVERREVHLWRTRGSAIVSMEEFRTLEEARDAAR